MKEQNRSDEEFKKLVDKLNKLTGGNTNIEGQLFNEAMRYDEFIYQLAMYHETHGHTQPVQPQIIIERFREFKSMVVGGEATVGELEKLVVGKFSLLSHLPDSDQKIIGFHPEVQENVE